MWIVEEENMVRCDDCGWVGGADELVEDFEDGQDYVVCPNCGSWCIDGID